mmetsp:Transcript_20097/g.34586  ORF Transcript_20097/g.34586 Transcript_20097/m.34586 type:complete len:292 (-) Transcript_20097:75-950(-)
MSGLRQRNGSTIPIARIAALALFVILSSPQISAFQHGHLLSPLTKHGAQHDIVHNNSHFQLHAKPSKKSKSKSGGGGGFGSSSGGFGSKKSKSSSSDRADPSKVRTVSGYTGSGTKVLAAAANNFDRIRKLFGKDATTDVYVRSPLNDESVFWFVGKVIRMVEDEGAAAGGGDGNELEGSVYPSEEEAVLSQKRLILEYAKNQLRPQNMGGPYAKKLELWSAPGDSEMDVVQNKITLVPITGSSRDLREGFHVKDVGYNPEIYVGEEQEKGGLRVVRDSEGRPVKAPFEIN